MGSNLIIVVFAVVVIGGMGSILGSILTGVFLGLAEGLTKVFLPGSLQHRGVCHHGGSAHAASGRTVWQGEIRCAPPHPHPHLHLPTAAARLPPPQPCRKPWALGLVAGLGPVAGGTVYWRLSGVFDERAVLCHFCLRLQLLLGYTGLLSFGHAAFMGSAAYVTGWLVRSAGFSPELGILAGTCQRRCWGFWWAWLPFAARAFTLPWSLWPWRR